MTTAATTATAAIVAMAISCTLDGSLKHHCNVDTDCAGNRICVEMSCEDRPTSNPLRANYMFVTSQAFPTRFQPLQVADDACNNAARSAGLDGEYRAWLSTTAVYARERLGTARGWIRVDGAPFADTVDDIGNGRIFYPPNVDEYGHEVAGTYAGEVVATGTNPSGYTDPGRNCDDWANDAAEACTAGVTEATYQSWTSGTDGMCGSPMRIYCFGIDRQIPVAPIASPGALAFLSDAPFTTMGGLAAADALCRQEASLAGLSGTFLALLPTSTSAAADRFADRPDEVWVRPDGVPINHADGGIFAGEPLLAPLNVTSGGAYVGGDNVTVLTGTDTPSEVGSSADTCDDWTSSQADGLVAYGYESNVALWFAYGGKSGCTDVGQTDAYIYCLQH